MSSEHQAKASDFIGRSMNLSGMIAYQQDAVVSKTVVAKKTGTVTLFAFDSGQGLSEHSAPYDALVQILDGEALVTIGGKDQVTRCGEIIIMPANIPHALKATGRFKMMLVMIKSE
jgi:quercetin dioxygenase-like cupin family protein